MLLISPSLPSFNKRSFASLTPSGYLTLQHLCFPFKSGDWWVICDVCSKKIKASDAKHRWDGFVVCQDDFENRHPQDYIRAKMDKISVPFTRPRGTDDYVDMQYLYTLPWYNPDQDTVNISDEISVVVSYVKTLTDTVTTSDELVRDITNGVLDTAATSDVLAYTFSATRTLNDTATTSDTLQFSLNTPEEINGSTLNSHTLG